MKKVLKVYEINGFSYSAYTKDKAEKKHKVFLNKEIDRKHIEWRNKIYERDDWTCQVCGTCYKDNVKGLNPMHILSKENYPQFRFDIMNGLTGCFYCHQNSKLSPHLDGFVFVHWLIKNKPEQYQYLINLLNKDGK